MIEPAVMAERSEPQFIFPPNQATEWPLSPDYPIVVDANGNVVSRFRDTVWKLAPWAGTALSVNFGDGAIRGRAYRCSPENATLLRHIAAWWLYGPRAVASPRTFETRVVLLKPLFATCSKHGILATDLSRFPRVIEEVAQSLNPGLASHAVSLLHDLLLARDTLGLVILDEAGIRLLSALAPERQSRQTAYIPPRIWTYQVLRLRACLDDFLKHVDKVEDCYRFCLDAYATNAGSLASSLRSLPQSKHPFHPDNEHKSSSIGCTFYGAFRRTSERFEIDGLLERWVNTSGQAGIKSLSGYLSLVNNAALAYVLNFSLMRIQEGVHLRCNSYRVERDSAGFDIHTLTARTTKTAEDENAQWIVSPSVALAIESLQRISALRMVCVEADPELHLSDLDRADPLLFGRANEPWASGRRSTDLKRACTYGNLVARFPKLFDLGELTITVEDLSAARQLNPDLDPELFAVGRVWPLAWHQLRRTGAVNMLSSGLVSEESLQYQLKHLSRATSRYYGQNHFRLNGDVDPEARNFYIREMYDAVARKFASLTSDRFVSPYGQGRKAQVINLMGSDDHAVLLRGARAGKITYRETFLGGCANPGPPCKLGGITNIVGCMGSNTEKPCEWAVVDREKRHVIASLKDVLTARAAGAEAGSLLEESLKAQICAAERALDVVSG